MGTDPGKVRKENQDCVASFKFSENVSITAVCDGMGGAASGAVASKIAIDSFLDRVKNNYRENMSSLSIKNMLMTAVHYANTCVYEKSQEDIKTNGMGTTLVAAFVDNKDVYIVNVGDSRAYLLQDSGIEQITTDHNYAMLLYKKGKITLEEMKVHPMRHVITRAIGVEPDVDVDFFEYKPQNNFTVILCSDGLSGYCYNDLIYQSVFGNNLKTAIKDLIKFSNDCGGKDNITVAAIAN